MKHEIRAVIDVGTTSVKLLVAEVAGRTVKPLFADAEVTRLGQGLSQTCVLSPEALMHTSQVVARFKGTAIRFRPHSIRVLGTSAAREAANPEDLARAIQQDSGLQLEVVAPEKEAELVFRGVTTDPKLANEPLIVFDLGGGSTEAIVGEGAFVYYLGSYPLGTLRLLELMEPKDAPSARDRDRCRAWVKEFINREISPCVMPVLKSFCGRKVRLVGTGGTVAVLAKLAVAAAKGVGTAKETRFDLDQVRRTVELLWSLPLAERLKIHSVPPQRADLVLTGSAILEQMLVQLGFAELTISRRGMRYGAVLAHPDGLTPEVRPEKVSTASLFHRPTAESFEAVPLTCRVSSPFTSFNTPPSTSSASVA